VTLRAAEFLPAGTQQKTIFAKCERKPVTDSPDTSESGDEGMGGEKKKDCQFRHGYGTAKSFSELS